MGIIAFLKEAGEKLFGRTVQAAEKDPNQREAANREAATAIENHLAKFGFNVTALTVTFDTQTATARVFGVAADQETKEKVILAAGNVEGVAAVEDMMTVVRAQPAAQFYTVVKGDTLSKIAKQFYGDANAYMRIFEANRPLLSHPDKIYPGQNLRIPPK
ncbi:MAG: peptidoglycan-binding protein LysM [Burkholderiaceae bacterium]|nr:peptidoglycan-binding protein LysM [Burkholderiaceae bacterium]